MRSAKSLMAVGLMLLSCHGIGYASPTADFTELVMNGCMSSNFASQKPEIAPKACECWSKDVPTLMSI